jgi:hypothetical protein
VADNFDLVRNICKADEDMREQLVQVKFCQGRVELS